LLGDGHKNGALANGYAERIKTAIDDVERHLGETISIGQAAELAGWSPYYFCKKFKQVTGRTFVEYVNMQRMNEAEKLLRSSTLTLELIAEKVGLGNAAY